MKIHLPNVITLLNLFCGCCALVAVMNGNIMAAFWFLFIGGWADFFDGFVARWLNVHSPLGKELDSLADMVSFGVVPGMMIYYLLSLSYLDTPQSISGLIIPALPGFLLTLFAGLRLAKFNLDERQTEDFIGLPSPALTVFITGLTVIYHYDSFGWGDWITEPLFLYLITAVFSYLLVAEIPIFGFKFKHRGWRGNEWRYSFILLFILFLIIFREAAFSLVIVSYVIFALIRNLLKKRPTCN